MHQNGVDETRRMELDRGVRGLIGRHALAAYDDDRVAVGDQLQPLRAGVATIEHDEVIAARHGVSDGGEANDGADEDDILPILPDVPEGCVLPRDPLVYAAPELDPEQVPALTPAPKPGIEAPAIALEPNDDDDDDGDDGDDDGDDEDACDPQG